MRLSATSVGLCMFQLTVSLVTPKISLRFAFADSSQGYVETYFTLDRPDPDFDKRGNMFDSSGLSTWGSLTRQDNEGKKWKVDWIHIPDAVLNSNPGRKMPAIPGYKGLPGYLGPPTSNSTSL